MKKPLSLLRFTRIPLLMILFVSLFHCNKANEIADNYDERYNISFLQLSDRQFDTSDKTENARTIDLVADDTMLFIHSRETSTVVQYHLTNAGDISSAEYVYSFHTNDYLGTANQDQHGHGIYIQRETLDRMWLFNRTEIWQFDFVESGNLSTAAHSGYNDLTDYVSRGHDIDFNHDGSRFYVEDRNEENVYQFLVEENWDINQLEFDYALDISETHSAVRGIEFRPDGRKMYLLDTSLKQIQQFDLSTPWELRSATFEQYFLLEIENPRGLTWNSDGSQAYVMCATTGIIRQYSIVLK
jgi:hypothetical protein